MNSDGLPQQVAITSGAMPVRRPIVKGEWHAYGLSSFLLC